MSEDHSPETIWEERLRGMPWHLLAQRHHITIEAAKDACLQAAQHEHTTTTQRLDEADARLVRLQAALWNGALKGDPAAAAQIRAIITDRNILATQKEEAATTNTTGRAIFKYI